MPSFITRKINLYDDFFLLHFMTSFLISQLFSVANSVGKLPSNKREWIAKVLVTCNWRNYHNREHLIIIVFMNLNFCVFTQTERDRTKWKQNLLWLNWNGLFALRSLRFIVTVYAIPCAAWVKEIGKLFSMLPQPPHVYYFFVVSFQYFFHLPLVFGRYQMRPLIRCGSAEIDEA